MTDERDTGEMPAVRAPDQAEALELILRELRSIRYRIGGLVFWLVVSLNSA